MKLIFIFLLFSTTLSGIYNIPLSSIDNMPVSLSSFSGKKILIVNTGCNSKDTAQFAQLEQLHQLHQDSLVILVVPSHSFGHELSTTDSIKQFIRGKYNAHFIITSPLSVNGNADELYQWLTQKQKNGVMDNEVAGDFQKFLINEHGVLVGVFAPSVTPGSTKIQNAIAIDWP